jgi:hypothetical protein
MDVLVVGFFQGFTANIDPSRGQIGDYFAIDGVPFAPFLNVTDGRDHGIFGLTGNLTPGPHTFRWWRSAIRRDQTLRDGRASTLRR